ncbi:MAG: hypothetical protein JWM71_258 [Solirubrobacteraceae bacterium]|nr:hypothetical protein [Solirubrobacteraceae bacterium]
MTTILRLTLILAAGALAAAPCASAAGNVTGAYVYYRPYAKPDKSTRGTAWLIIRTKRAFAESGGVVQGHMALAHVADGYTFDTPISRELHCYGSFGYVSPKSPLRIGKRVRVSVAGHGWRYSARLLVSKRRPGDPQGKRLGCTKDPSTAVAVGGITNPTPEFQPERVFYTYGAGPAVIGLTWTGWGTAEAVGEGTFVCQCYPPPENSEPAKIVYSAPRYQAFDGYSYYTRQCVFRTRDGVYGGKEAESGADC